MDVRGGHVPCSDVASDALHPRLPGSSTSTIALHLHVYNIVYGTIASRDMAIPPQAITLQEISQWWYAELFQKGS